jgi:hypothetical protein
VGRYARRLGGRRVFLVSDPGVASTGWTAETEALGLPMAGLPDRAAREQLVLQVRELGRDCGIGPLI